MLPLSKNPLIYRRRCESLRPGRFMGVVIGMFTLLGLILLYLVLSRTMRDSYYSDAGVIDWPGTWEAFCHAVLYIQYFIGFYVTLFLILDVLVIERQRNTYDFSSRCRSVPRTG